MSDRRRASCASEASLNRLRCSLLVPAAQTTCLTSFSLPAWHFHDAVTGTAPFLSSFGDLAGCSFSLRITGGRPANAEHPRMSPAFRRVQLFTTCFGLVPSACL